MAKMEYEHREDLRSKGKRVCLVLRSQESKLGVVTIGIQDEEANLRLYIGVRNVTVGLYIHCITISFIHKCVGVTLIDEASWLL